MSRSASGLVFMIWLMPIVVIALGVTARQAGAVSAPSFSQRILPLNCVFQTINDGTGTLYYLTPAACGVIETNPSSNSITGLPSVSAAAPEVNAQGYSAPSSYAPIPNDGAGNPVTSSSFPWRPISTRIQASTKTTPVSAGSKSLVGIVIVSITAVVTLLVFIF